MQMGTKEDPDERFTHYLTKTFKKTASFLAHTCMSVSKFMPVWDNHISVTVV